jgi:hypothetical protein
MFRILFLGYRLLSQVDKSGILPESSRHRGFPGIYFLACNICRSLPATPGAGNSPEKTVRIALFTFSAWHDTCCLLYEVKYAKIWKNCRQHAEKRRFLMLDRVFSGLIQ